MEGFSVADDPRPPAYRQPSYLVSEPGRFVTAYLPLVASLANQEPECDILKLYDPI